MECENKKLDPSEVRKIIRIYSDRVYYHLVKKMRKLKIDRRSDPILNAYTIYAAEPSAFEDDYTHLFNVNPLNVDVNDLKRYFEGNGYMVSLAFFERKIDPKHGPRIPVEINPCEMDLTIRDKDDWNEKKWKYQVKVTIKKM